MPHPLRHRRYSRRAFLAACRNSAAALLLTGCAAGGRDWLPAAPTAPPADGSSASLLTNLPLGNVTPTPVPPPAAPTATLDTVPAASLETKVGQMLMVGLSGAAINEQHPIVQDIRTRDLGGVIVQEWTDNIQSPAQVAALIGALQGYATVPLLVAVDYEGGLINRLPEHLGFPATVTHEYLGQHDDLELTRRYGAIMGQTLAQLGINLNLAPTVDVKVNPDNPIIARYQRSFSADPAIVTRHAQAFVTAHHAQRVLCTLKHFPGHGSSSTDSHLELTDVTASWSRTELEPYRALLASVPVDAVMTAHVFHGGLDPVYPATLSEAIIGGLLRGELGYQGVVISDDMFMKAITDHYGFERAVEQAVHAGVDILLFARADPGIAARAHALLMQLVWAGKLSEARIDASYRRIMLLKRRWGRMNDPSLLYFAETDQTLQGVFLEFWRANGGLAHFGFPLTGERLEEGLTVQYFERVRFDATSQGVQLAPLGRLLTAQRQNEAPFQPTPYDNGPRPYITETQHHISLEFIYHWQQGGAALYGFPISEPFEETSAVTGERYLVQYFARARFERHPSHIGTPYEIQLGMLGAEWLRTRPGS